MKQRGLIEPLKTTPLAASQMRHWLQCQSPTSNAGLLPVTAAFSIDGSLEKSRLLNALSQVFDRHTALKMRIIKNESGPTMMWDESAELMTTQDSLTAGYPAVQYLEDCTRTSPFDLDAGPLVRVHLASYDDKQHILVIVGHHLAVDYSSLNILLREVSIVYSQQTLPPSLLQFAEFAQVDNVARSRGLYNKQLNYWQKQLTELEPAELTQDKKPPASRKFSAAQIEFELDHQYFERVLALAEKLNSSPHAVLLAGYFALLQRQTRCNDLAVATTVHGRNGAQLTNIVGSFEGTLPIRSQLTATESFSSLVTQVNESTQNAISNSDVLFDEIVRHVKPQRVPDQLPFSPFMFLLRDEQAPALDLKKLHCQHLALVTKASEYDVLLEIRAVRQDGASIYRARFIYSDERYFSNSIQRFCQQYKHLLGEALLRPETPVAQLELISQSEKLALITELNPTPTSFDSSQNFVDLIWQQAQKHPDKIAVHDDAGKALSYQQLTHQAEQLAIHLQQLGAGPGILIALSVNRSTSMLLALLGILRSGSAYLPMDPTYPSERVRYILQDAGAPVLITEQRLKDSLPKTDAKVLCIDTEWQSISAASLNGLPLVESTRVYMEDPAYVIYTSGSTGNPKGVRVTHSNVLNFLLSMQQEPGFTADDKLLAVTTLSFDISVLELFLPLITGAQLVVASRELAVDGKQLANFLNSEKISFLQATPTTWRLLLESGWSGNTQLKGLMGGEAMPADILPRLLPKLGSLWNMYGPTETTVWSTCQRITDATAEVSIGKPIANTRVYILDERQQLCPYGTPGELCIAGDGVSNGYTNREELNTAQFLPDPFSDHRNARLYRTGDLARWLEDGSLSYLGRLDNLVKLNGYRIELGEIESVLSSLEGVAHSAVMVREDTPDNKRLVAYWTASNDEKGSINSDHFQQYLATKLPAYMIPQQFFLLPSMPQTPNGKLDRKALPNPISFVAPEKNIALETAMQREVALKWQELIGTANIVPTSNFFSLGGHSLAATKFIHWVENQYNIKLPMRILIMSSLSQVATRLDPTSIASVGLSQLDSNARPEISVQHIDNNGLQLFCSHVRSRQQSKQALLMVASHGYEQSRADRSYRSLALELAKKNVHSMRLDLSGMGNSSLASTEITSLEQWRSDIRCAAKALLQQSGCASVSVLAGRFSASLLDRELFEDIPLAHAFLWDPIASGANWWQARLQLYKDMTASGYYYLKPRQVSDPEGLQTPGLSINSQLRAEIDAFALSPKKLDERFHILQPSDLAAQDFGSAKVVKTADNLNWYDTLACSSTDIDSFEMRRYLQSVLIGETS